MSARLNQNQVPIISWKGKTFQQITSSIKKNAPVSKNVSMANGRIFKANPLKIYRREIVTAYDTSSCVARTAIKIDELNRPNGYIITSCDTNGLVNTLDIGLTTNTSDLPGLCNTPCVLSADENARRRVRSSGNIKKKFDPANNAANYYTDNKQYLASRVKTFNQNQYNYIKQGDATLKPGHSLSVSNLYVGNGFNTCKKYYINVDTSFSYLWPAVDMSGNYVDTTVDLSAGYYDVEDINAVLHSKLLKKGHYYIKNTLKTKVFLLNIVYNNSYNKIEVQTLKTGPSDAAIYSIPDLSGQESAWMWTYPPSDVVPQITIHDNAFRHAIGFANGIYPTQQSSSVDVISLSSFEPAVTPRYQPLYYKPNNPQFAQQGAVSASALTARVRYNSITNATTAYRDAYGTEVANALAYGVPGSGYTVKDKIGYPNTCYPVFPKEGGVRSSTCAIRKNA